MLSYLASALTWVMNHLQTSFIIFGFVICLGVITKLSCNNSSLANDNQDLKNKLADGDSLKTTVNTALLTLQERYSHQENDLADALSQNETLQAHLNTQKATILALVKKVTKVEADSMTFAGKVKKDSVGEYAEFDTSTAYYSLLARARLHPFAKLYLDGLLMVDSSYVGFYGTKDGMVRGFISHSNPYLLDTGGEFTIKSGLNTSVAELPPSMISWDGLWLHAGHRLRDGVFGALSARIQFFGKVEFTPSFDSFGTTTLSLGYRVF